MLMPAVRDATFAKARALIADAKKSGLGAAAAKDGFKVFAPPEFSVSEGLKDDPNAQSLMRVAAEHNEGEFADPVETMDGALLVVRVAARKPAERGKLAGMRGMINDLLVRERERGFLSAYDDALLKKDGFADLARGRQQQAEDEDRNETDRRRDAAPQQNPF